MKERKQVKSKKGTASTPKLRRNSLAEFFAKSRLRGSGVVIPRIGDLRVPDFGTSENKQEEVLSLFGTIDYDENYDYKKERKKR